MNEKNGRFLCSLCSIWSLGTALAMALLPALGHSIGFWKSGGYILTAALLLQLLLRKKWLLPTILGGGMLMGLLLSMLIRQNTAWLRYWNGFFSWWHSGCPQLLPYSGGSALFWVRLLTVLPAVGLLILLEQLPVQIELPVVLLGGSGLLIWLYLRKEQALIAVAALLCVRVLTDLSRLCGRQILRTLGGQQQVSAAGMRLCAFLMAGAAALCAVLILPDRDGEWRWDALVQLTEDIGDLYLEGTGRLSADSGFSIGISGWMPLGEKLGGDIQPNNDILLRVKTDTPTLLAGAVYNTYDGASWTDSGDLGRYRYGSLFWRGRKNEVFGTRLPSGRTASRIFDGISRTAEYTVSSGIYTAEIFTAGRLQSVEPDKEDTELYFNRQGELFLEERKSGQRYTLTATVLTRDAEDFDRQMLLLEETLADKRDSQWEEITAEYLSLPDSLPESVYTQAAEITDGIEDPYLQARALESWLQENCSYTLTPGTPEDGDFVAQFLEKREGYCVYYATAMAVMARTLGLPSRYLTGYGLKENPTENASYPYVATNATAHAWCEIYFSGIGWIPFDPTGWDPNEPAAEDEPEPAVPTETAEVQTTPEPPEPAPEETAELPAEIEPEQESFPWYKLLTPIGAVVLAAGLLWIRIRMKKRQLNRLYRRLMRRYPDYPARIDRCWEEILRQLRLMDLTPAPTDTLSTFAERVSPHVPDFREVAARMIEIRFTERMPDDADLAALCRFSGRLEQQLIRELGRRKYLWRRILIGR